VTLIRRGHAFPYASPEDTMTHTFARVERVDETEHEILPPLLDTPFEQGVYLPLNGIELAEIGQASVVVNGDLAVSWVGSTFTGEVDEDGEPRDADVRVQLRGAAAFELAVAAGADVAGVLQLATIPLPSCFAVLLIKSRRRPRPRGRPGFLAGWPAQGMSCEIWRR
jgi:hypothetical protein